LFKLHSQEVLEIRTGTRSGEVCRGTMA